MCQLAPVSPAEAVSVYYDQDASVKKKWFRSRSSFPNFILSLALVIGPDLSGPPVRECAITVRFSFGIVKTK